MLHHPRVHLTRAFEVILHHPAVPQHHLRLVRTVPAAPRRSLVLPKFREAVVLVSGERMPHDPIELLVLHVAPEPAERTLVTQKVNLDHALILQRFKRELRVRDGETVFQLNSVDVTGGFNGPRVPVSIHDDSPDGRFDRGGYPRVVQEPRLAELRHPRVEPRRQVVYVVHGARVRQRE